MSSHPRVRSLVPEGLLAALATGLLALSSAGAAAAASDAGPPAPEPARATAARSEAAAATGVVINWKPAEKRFEAAEPEQAAALVRELQRLLAGGLAERLHLASGPTLAQRTEGGLIMARIPAELIDLAVVRVDEEGGFAGACTQGPSGALDLLAQGSAPVRPEEE